MFIRFIPAVLVVCSLLLAPIAGTAADRGPSTPEERKRGLEYIQDFEANPLGPQDVQEREWVLRWIIEIPDIHVQVCMILDKMPKGDKTDAATVFLAEAFSQTAFLIQNPVKQDDTLAQFQAGVEVALRVYEALLKANPKDRQPYLDDLIQRREAGTLAQFVKDRAAAACKN
jgi:hypothetical protein